MTKLIGVTFEAMWEGINAVKPGATLGDIGHAIQRHAEAKKYAVVRDFCGHGLGQVFHDAPNVMHYGEPGQGDELREGMFFTIEPMINTGTYEVKILAAGGRRDPGWFLFCLCRPRNGMPVSRCTEAGRALPVTG